MIRLHSFQGTITSRSGRFLLARLAALIPAASASDDDKFHLSSFLFQDYLRNPINKDNF